MSLDRWLLGAAFTLTMVLAGSWASSIHSQLSEIKGAVQSIAAAQSTFATEVALIKLRLDRLERGTR